MKPSDRHEFAQLILGAAEVYEKTPTDSSIELYWESLVDLSITDVRAGIARHMRDQNRGRFMPRPADIRQASVPARSPVVAWAEVERAMSRFGAYRSVRFEDATTNAVIKDLGGWPWVCSQNFDEPWTQKEFERRYEAYKTCGVESKDPLLGISDRENINCGYLEFVRPLLIIGDGGRAIEEKLKLLEPSNGDRKTLSAGELTPAAQIVAEFQKAQQT